MTLNKFLAVAREAVTGHASVAVGGEHGVVIDSLPPIHKDPFDRMLVAQTMVEGITLLTADAIVAQYPGPVRRI
jgi:PIN domain nuclease of toxin-antitoxin system